MTTATGLDPAVLALRPIGVFVEDDAEDEPAIWMYRADDPNEPCHLISKGHFGRRGADTVWPLLLAVLPTRDEVLIECPVCDGAGEITVCVNDGTHGCSHQFDREYICAACTGGVVKLTDTENPDWCETCGLSGHCTSCAA